MKISTEGFQHLLRYEAVRTDMYLDPAGLPTIGIGHLLTKDELSSGKIRMGTERVRWRDGITFEDAMSLFSQDIAPAEEAINNLVTVTLTQTQFDTMVSFVFNVGVGAFARSTLLKKLNVGDHAEVPTQLARWVYSNGTRLAVLVARRNEEIKQWAA
jgi:lysozyme